MNNGKKEFPSRSAEQDFTSKWGRRTYCYIQNDPSVGRNVKRAMAKRFRRYYKLQLSEYQKSIYTFVYTINLPELN